MDAIGVRDELISRFSSLRRRWMLPLAQEIFERTDTDFDAPTPQVLEQVLEAMRVDAIVNGWASYLVEREVDSVLFLLNNLKGKMP